MDMMDAAMTLSRQETGNTKGCTTSKQYNMDVPVNIIHQPKTIQNKKVWKAERDAVLWNLKRYVCALRNSGGGIIWVSMIGVHPSDKCLEYFHELVDDRLNKMIPDGSLFANTCLKNWVNDEGENKGLIRFEVLPSDSIVTLDYKTKEPLDNCMIDTSSCKINKILKDGVRFESRHPTLRGLFENLQESRNVQLKALVVDEKVVGDISEFIQHIWHKLKLGHYITALSKVDGGGSFYLGINESDIHYGYKSKIFTQKGFQFHDSLHEDFIADLKAKARDETIVLRKKNEEGQFIQMDLVEAKFHPVGDNSDLYILEVAVAAVEGIVFYDTEGPEAYEINEKGEIQRLPIDQWYLRQNELTNASSTITPKEEAKQSNTCELISGDAEGEPTRTQLETELELVRAQNSKLKADLLASKQTEDELNRMLGMASLDGMSLGGLSLDSGHGSDVSSMNGWMNIPSLESTTDNMLDTTTGPSGQARSKGFINCLKEKITGRTMKRKGLQPTFILDDGPVFVITDINRKSPIFLQCFQQKLDQQRFNKDVCTVSEDGAYIINFPASAEKDIQAPKGEIEKKSEDSLRFCLYRGTCTQAVFPLPKPKYFPICVQYWETRIEGEIGKKTDMKAQPLAEVGLGKQIDLDTKLMMYMQPRSWCICVAICDSHRLGLCTQVWCNGDLVKCVPQPVGHSFARTFGILLDNGSKTLVFIDADKGTLLHKFGHDFKNPLCPMFGIVPSTGELKVKIMLMSGTDVTFTVEKQQLIHSCVL